MINLSKMQQAENIRYNKIEILGNLLCKDNVIPINYDAMDSLDKPFNVGKRISVNGENIVINKKTYSSFEIKSVTLNTEGSMAIFDRSGKKLCGWASLNLAAKNIELFCLWVRKHNIPAKVVSGSSEKGFQWFFMAAVIFVLLLIYIIKDFI